MSDRLLSVGLDVGTTSTQLIFSQLIVENKAGSFSVPEMEIAQRKILYKSDVHFTPLLGVDLVDAPALRRIIDAEYQKAGISRSAVDTGAIIITGETSRKENAEAVLHELSGFAGEFVVATAGPDLESVLAAKGAGADAYSERTGKTVLHMDIGGGTSNLALIRDGKIVKTGCLNVGGRLIKFDNAGKITYLSPVLDGICALKVGDSVTPSQLEAVSQTLASALEMAAGLREPTELLEMLWTKESNVIANQSADWCGNLQNIAKTPGDCHVGLCPPRNDSADLVLSFSGGVADCISREIPWTQFGDIGPILGQAIRESQLCKKAYILGEETIRATVIGAGCHSAQLSGSTVFCQNIQFPLKNLPVVPFPSQPEELSVLSIPGIPSPSYAQIRELASQIAASWRSGPLLICLEQDMAKALGQALAVRLPAATPILCIDRVKLTEGSYLDVAAPVGPALPVVVKTLVLSR